MYRGCLIAAAHWLFPKENLVVLLHWGKAATGPLDTRACSITHEFVLFYAKGAADCSIANQRVGVSK